MKSYMITSWTFTTVLVHDVEFEGTDIVLGTFEGQDAEEAKQKASKETGIESIHLNAFRLA